jgi:hypothetical protein
MRRSTRMSCPMSSDHSKQSAATRVCCYTSSCLHDSKNQNNIYFISSIHNTVYKYVNKVKDRGRYRRLELPYTQPRAGEIALSLWYRSVSDLHLSCVSLSSRLAFHRPVPE